MNSRDGLLAEIILKIEHSNIKTTTQQKPAPSIIFHQKQRINSVLRTTLLLAGIN
jgi:hypothetical protein